jgi:lipid II:glycine glycyltransferase (peptidoglycan interpeptide bridge formation enzyme)
MKLDIQIVNPIEYEGWDNLILSHPDYSFFHSSAWAKVLSEAYGYTPLYFTVINRDGIEALIPAMEVNSFLTGRRGVSLPFTDYCEPMINDGIKFQDLMDSVTEYGKKAAWRYLEFRGGKNLYPFPLSSCTFLGHTLNLSDKENQTFSNFRDSTKRTIKKAMKEGVEVNINYSPESIREFYRLNCMTRKRHGLPPQPYLFFKKVYDHIICKKLGFVVLASFHDKPIAGGVYFHFGEKAVYKYGASDLNYQNLRANNLVMWEAVKWCCQSGFKHFCFGRTEPENQGLIQFKSGWGTTEQEIRYYRYDLKKNVFVNPTSKLTGFYNTIFRKIPIPVLNIIGASLYKHVG